MAAEEQNCVGAVREIENVSTSNFESQFWRYSNLMF